MPPNRDPEALDRARRLDRLCDRFETEWRAGERPCVEDFLVDVPEADRETLREALLAVEEELQRTGSLGPISVTPPEGPVRVPGYEILSELGRGGMGVVYRARQTSLNRTIALKMILAGDHADPNAVSRFLAEAELAARLQHPNIVQIHEVGTAGGRPFFSLEYVAGGSLANRLRGEPQPPADAARLVEVLARAMHHAHVHGVVHRDLKPANVLLAAGGSAPSSEADAKPRAADIPKVADFGLARGDDSDLTATGAVLGTPSYMAPEQAEGRKEVGPAADTWALGAVLYECLTGRPPFRGATAVETIDQVRTREPVPVRTLQPRVPPDLETIALKCLQKSPARRYPTAEALADDLHRFLDGRAITARPVGQAERVVRWCRRHPLATILTATLVLVLAAGFVGVTSFWMMARDQRDRAERNFERVFGAIDQSFTQVSTSQELKADELLPFRKRLLIAAQQQYQGFVAELGDNPRAEEALVRSWIRLAQINRELGSKAEAEQAARTSVALAEKFVQKAPTLENRGLLAWAWEEQMLATPNAGEQRRATQHVLELLEALVRDDPGNEAALSGLARAYYNAGVGHDEAADSKEALVWISRARDLLERKAAAGPLPLAIDEFRVQVLQHLARLQVDRSGGRFTEALASCQQAIDLAGRLAREHPRESRLVIHLADALIEQNLIRSQANRPAAECVASLQQANSVLEEVLAAGVPSGDARARVQRTRAMVVYNLSCEYLANGQTARARPVLKQTRELCDKLLLTDPDNPDLHHWLASSCTRLALLDQKEGQMAEVLGLLERARPSMEAALRAFPDPARRSELGELLQALGTEYYRLEQPAKAAGLLQEAIEQQRQACAAEPGLVDYRLALAESYLELANVQRSRNLLGEAVAAALEASKGYHDRPAELYKVAVELAQSMNQVADDRATLSPEQESERRRYARHTLQTLKAAVAAGYRDGDALRKEPAFAGLRDRDEFKQLLP